MTNEELIKEYPFLQLRNRWTDKIVEDADCTELDFMEPGWRSAFGEQMCQELKEVLIKANLLEHFRIRDIKEKYGMMRFYYNIDDTEHNIAKIVDKYEHMSEVTCCKCGVQAVDKYAGLPLCESCAKAVVERMRSIINHD